MKETRSHAEESGKKIIIPEVDKGEEFTLFASEIVSAKSEIENVISYTYPINLKYDRLTLPLLIDGAFDDKGFYIMAVPNNDEIIKRGYLTETRKRLKDGILLAVRETTLKLIIPIEENNIIVNIKPIVSGDKKDFAFSFETQSHSLSADDVIRNWTRLKGIFEREE